HPHPPTHTDPNGGEASHRRRGSETFNPRTRGPGANDGESAGMEPVRRRRASDVGTGFRNRPTGADASWATNMRLSKTSVGGSGMVTSLSDSRTSFYLDESQYRMHVCTNQSATSSNSRIQTPVLSRRPTRGKNLPVVDDARFYEGDGEAAPGVAVHGVRPIQILQKELEILSLVAQKLDETVKTVNLRQSVTLGRPRQQGCFDNVSREGSVNVNGRHEADMLCTGVSLGLESKQASSDDGQSDRNEAQKPSRLESMSRRGSTAPPATLARRPSKLDGFRDFMNSMLHAKSKSPSTTGPVARSGSATDDPEPTKQVRQDSKDIKYTIDDFELREQIGKGAYARVILVRSRPGRTSPSRDPSRVYAMKCLRKAEIVATKQVKHVMDEKNLLGSLKSPFVVELLATFQDQRHLFILMEYVPGGDMFTHLRRNRKFKEETARFYTVELVLALKHIHAQGIVYRDLKPENILLTRSGHIKLADFGFACRLEKNQKTQTFCGTPAYIAPEIILKVAYDKSVDWWSLGIVSYELRAGYSPFYAETPLQIYENIIDGKMRWSSKIGERHRSLLRRLLEMEPSERLGGGPGEGAEDVMKHPWFEGVDWRAHEDLRVTPPYVPDVSDEGDVSNFDVYAEVSSVIGVQEEGTKKGKSDDGAYDYYFRKF
ncbi:camp-dependent protein kinase catalytic subunit, partial [Phlyctochytrium bullatum]